MPHPNGPCMRSGMLPNGQPQAFYFPEDYPSMPSWFKGMEIIIRECGLWLGNSDLLAQCPGFHCPPGHADCCCQCILFLQPDFMSQKPQLQELIESCGHLCKFYPKYHCELNFIKQYWGAAKLQFHMVGHTATMDEMEQKIINCLDDIHSFKFGGESSTFFFSSYLPHHDIFLATQTDLHTSFQHITLVL